MFDDDEDFCPDCGISHPGPACAEAYDYLEDDNGFR
jgi:hypothetical protein